MRKRNSKAIAIGLALALVPVAHPLLDPVLADVSHVLWLTHAIVVGLIVFQRGWRATVPAAIGSGVLVALGEAAFGQGYGVASEPATILAVSATVTIVNFLGAYFALQARVGNQRYSVLFEHSMDGIIIHRMDGRVVEVNPRAVELCGYSEAELVSMTVPDLLAEDARSEFAAACHEVLRTGQAYARTRLLNADGEEVPIRVWATAVESGTETVIQALMQDVTELERDRRLQSLLVTAVEQTAESVHIADVRGVVEYANPSFERLTGLSATDSIGNAVQILEADDDPEFSRELHNAVAKGTVWKGAITRLRDDGTEYAVEASVSPVRDRNGNMSHVVVVQRDVTRERELELRLTETQKLETIGTLAGGIAHDFNNLLTPILGYADLGRLELPEDHELRHDLDRIAEAATRGKGLVEQILAFSRRTEPERKSVRVAGVVEEALNLLAPTLPANVEVRRDFRATTAHVLGDATQIHQVVVNLCSNAVHAMTGKGGVLAVRLIHEEVEPGFARKHAPLQPGPHIRLTVTDSGHGMDETTVKRIFEPFFTTKDPGEGTGLGMSVVHGVVAGHGGNLLVESAPGVGTRVDVYLPLHEAQEVVEDAGVPLGRSQGARILFVDDEVEIGRLVKKILERRGHEVTVETRSTNAMVRLNQTPGAFDLLITDQTMPDVTGAELAQAALEARHDLPVIIITGYSESLTAERAADLGIRDYLFKPLRPSELADAVEKALMQTV